MITFNEAMATEIGVTGKHQVFMFDGFVYEVTEVVGDQYMARPVDADLGADDETIGWFY